MTRKLPTLCIATTTEELIEFMKKLPDDPKELKPCPSEKELEQIAKEVFGFAFIDDIDPHYQTFAGDTNFTDRIKKVLRWNTCATPQPQPHKWTAEELMGLDAHLNTLTGQSIQGVHFWQRLADAINERQSTKQGETNE